MWRLAGGVVLLFGLACAGGSPTPQSTPYVAPPPPMMTGVELRDDDILVHGASDASDVVLVFSDWMCPHCEVAWPETVALTKDRPDTQLRFRSFPIDGDCNPVVTTSSPPRCELAKAALCAAEEGAFLDYASAAFPLGDAVLSQTAWTGVRMTACMERPDISVLVSTHAQSGAALGVRGTPTMFVRVGGAWQGPVPPHQLAEMLVNSE